MSRMRQNIYTVLFSVVLSLSCAMLLTAAADFTRQAQTENKKAEEIRNVLTALKAPFDFDADAGELINIFESSVTEQVVGRDNPLTLYTYKPAGSASIAAVAVRFMGPGLWGPIKGFLALEPDYKTIRGITFYEQEETPGLGGEIVSAGFRNGFEGKHISDEQDMWGINLVSAGGEQASINEIAGISGATMTCDKVEEMINAVIQQLAANREAYGK